MLTFPLERERGKVPNDLGYSIKQEIHSVPHENQLSIVGYEATRRSIVNDACRRRGNNAKCVDVLF